MANLEPLKESIARLITLATKIVGVQNSAVAVLNGITPIVLEAVAAALKADNDVDDATAAVANEAVAAVLAQLGDNTDLLAAAVAANPGTPPPPPPPPPEV